jgi:hypothetical protein
MGDAHPVQAALRGRCNSRRVSAGNECEQISLALIMNNIVLRLFQITRVSLN